MLRHLIEVCVRRRIAALAVTAAIALYGVSAYLSLPVEAYPDVTNVQVQINTAVAALAPEEIEMQVTFPLESQMSGIPGMVG